MPGKTHNPLTGKLIAIAAVLTTVVWLTYEATQKVRQWAQAIATQIVDFQLPSMQAGKLTIPVKVRITNNSPLVASLQNVYVRLSILRNGTYQEFGTAHSGPFLLKSGITDQFFYPVIDPSKFNPLSANGNLLQNISQVLTNKEALVDVKIETIVTVEGFTLDPQVEQKKLYLKQLLAA